MTDSRRKVKPDEDVLMTLTVRPSSVVFQLDVDNLILTIFCCHITGERRVQQTEGEAR